MKNFKKIIIFVIILILVNSIIYIYPMYKITSIYTTEQKNITISTDINTNYGRMENIISSDIADEYKRDAILLFTDSTRIRNEQRNEFYKILVYSAIIISIVISILGFVIRRKSVNNKYIGTAFISSSIFSIMLLCLFYYSIYMSLQ